MNILGIGPTLAISGFGSLFLVIAVDYFKGVTISAPETMRPFLIIAGILVLIPGILLWAFSARQILKGFNAHELVTTGAFAYSRNPMYSAFIVFMVPAIALFTNNFLFLVVSFIMYAAFKVNIKIEEKYLAKEFGVSYKQYKEEVPELFPFRFISGKAETAVKK